MCRDPLSAEPEVAAQVGPRARKESAMPKPKNVRNFWIEGSIDGRLTKLVGGPESEGGGLHFTVYQRDKGEVVEALQLWGFAIDNQLTLEVSVQSGVVAYIDGSSIRIQTER